MEIVYNDIARIFNTTRDRVERCMRHCSKNAKENIKQKYNYTGKITTKVILQLLVKETYLKELPTKEELDKYFY